MADSPQEPEARVPWHKRGWGIALIIVVLLFGILAIVANIMS